MLVSLLLHGVFVVFVLFGFGRWLDDEALSDLCAYALVVELVSAVLLTRYVSVTDSALSACFYAYDVLSSGLGIAASLVFDELSGFFLGLLALALLACFALLVEYFEYDAHAGSIALLSAAFSQAALLYFCAADLFGLILFWEVISLISFFLVQHWAHRLPTFKAGLKVFTVSQLGDLPLFGFLVLALAQHCSSDIGELLTLAPLLAFDYLAWGGMLVHLPTALGGLLSAAVFLKAAQFVFYPWLLDAMEAPVPISAQLHSSTLVVIGFYLFFRFYPLFALAPGLLSVLVVFGICTAVGASLLGFMQEDGKRLLACSTASQLGYVVVALGLGLPEEALWLLLFCCANKAFTFVWFGALMRRHAGLSDFRFIGGGALCSWAEHAGLLAAVANFTVWPGAFSWHVKGLLAQGELGGGLLTALGLELLQLTWFFSSLYLWALYAALFCRPARASGVALRGGSAGGACAQARGLSTAHGQRAAGLLARGLSPLTPGFRLLMVAVELALVAYASLECLSWVDAT
jgi:NADH:ubiquinone oxidoreductase subunit 5 (subunit L)/multisubunit Na+/H+ antiporter MnhA subunit